MGMYPEEKAWKNTIPICVESNKLNIVLHGLSNKQMGIQIEERWLESRTSRQTRL